MDDITAVLIIQICISHNNECKKRTIKSHNYSTHVYFLFSLPNNNLFKPPLGTAVRNGARTHHLMTTCSGQSGSLITLSFISVLIVTNRKCLATARLSAPSSLSVHGLSKCTSACKQQAIAETAEQCFSARQVLQIVQNRSGL